MTIALKDNPTTQPETGVSDRVWAREEYDRLVDLDFFQGQRVELIEGRILQRPRQSVRHSIGIELVDRYLRRACPKGYRICNQLPMLAGDFSEPEPDLAIIAGDDLRAIKEHPSMAVLIAEISDTTLQHDRNKARLYAASGVGEYWILNLTSRTLEVYRQPIPGASPATLPYAHSQIFGENETVAPLAAPSATTMVAELLP